MEDKMRNKAENNSNTHNSDSNNSNIGASDSYDEIISLDSPWGYMERLAHNKQCTVKIITLEQGQRLSLQSHKNRDELWIPLNEGLIVEVGEKAIKTHVWQKLKIPRGTKHRAYASTHACKILEISFGHFDENDIERYSDDYGRADKSKAGSFNDDNSGNSGAGKSAGNTFERLISGEVREVPKSAVLLAGGKGTRLRPITYEIPKALIPVQGRTITEHLFDLFRKYEIKQVYMTVGYLKERIKAHFKDGSRYGIRIDYIEEEGPLGTAGAVKLLKGKLQGPFVVSNGDELKDIDVAEMYEFHKKHKESHNAKATIALTTVDNPSLYGVARLDGARILDFVEKPANPPSNMISAGFYIIEPDVLELIPEGFAMFEKDVFPILAKKGQLFGFPFSGQWFDTGNMERYETALKNWKGVS